MSLQKESPAPLRAEQLTCLAASGYLQGDVVVEATAEEELHESGQRNGHHSIAWDRDAGRGKPAGP